MKNSAWMGRPVMPDDGYFDLSPTDRSMAILDRTSPVAFHAIGDLIGSVDLDSLAWAWQALARAHPILSCTTDVDAGVAWRPWPESISLNLIEGGDVDQATARTLAVPLDLINGPIVRLTAITRTDGLRLVLAAHHAAFDGAASVVLIDDLRMIYLDRLAGRTSVVEPDFSPRTVKSALNLSPLSMRTRQSFIAQSLDRWRKLPPSAHLDPSTMPSHTATGYAAIDLSPALNSIDEKRRRNSWSMDAVLVGLLEAAWDEVFGHNEGAGVWLVATNLRPGLGMRRGLGNLSGMEAIAVTGSEAQPVDRLIEQASAGIAATRSGFPGLGPELMARPQGWLPAALLSQGADMMIRAGLRQRYTRIISNMGRLPDSLTDWGMAQLASLKYLGPMARGPYSMFVIQSQGASTSLTVRTAQDWFTEAHAEQLEAAINRICPPSEHGSTERVNQLAPRSV